MRTFIVFLFTILLASSQAQMIRHTLDNYNLKEAELVLFTFGIDNPLSVGSVDDKGNLSIDVSMVEMPELSDELKDMYISELRNVFRFGCGGRDDFGPQGNIPAIRGGNIALWIGNEWAGSFFLVSDPALKPWLEDEGYNSAVKATLWDIIYVGEDVKLDLNCTNEIGLESGNVEVRYIYDLDLKKGFNWVEYSIEDVYLTNPEEKASFPSKVKISNLQDPGKMKWMVNYFF
jgi:hypothetical protein